MVAADLDARSGHVVRFTVMAVPARAWAAAVIDGASATVDAKLESGHYRTIVLRPTARIEALAQGEDDD